MPGRRIESFEVLPAIQQNPWVRLNLFWSSRFGFEMEKINNLSNMYSKPFFVGKKKKKNFFFPTRSQEDRS